MTFGVVPLENSSYGSVITTLDLLADRQSEYPAISVCGEVYLDIHHYLLGYRKPANQQPQPYESLISREHTAGDITPTNKIPDPTAPRSKPLTDVSHIQRIYSHTQGFGQCSAFLSTFLKSAEQKDVSSTSKGAQIAADDPTRTSAAICSKSAAEAHGLDVLAECIETRNDNKTRFLILRRGDHLSVGSEAVPRFGSDVSGKKVWKTLLTFTIDHCEAGALAKALFKFETCGFNLTSINSRPSGGKPWHYVFFVECEGRSGDGERKSVAELLRGLREVTEGCRCYGSWDSRSSPTG